MYGWFIFMKLWDFGSSGGIICKYVDFGGKGGGWVNVIIIGILVIDGLIEVDGGFVGYEGGGGFGGSIFVWVFWMWVIFYMINIYFWF